ncbi:MAG: glycoside hydrolase family 26 protein [Treponema sp.]|nr:glycoside hydrolase family 26 protein [Treponema sp.]
MKKLSVILVTLLLSFSLFAAELADKNATDNAKRLYKYLNDIYGSKVLTGQMENSWNNSCKMLNRVNEDTSKYPAIMGFDFMNYTSLGWNGDNRETQRAISFWNGKNFDRKKISDKHGIVAFMWHWRDPMTPSGNTGSFSANESAFRIPYDTEKNKWKTSSEEYKEMMADLDVIAAELAKLQDEGIPVLWRPMHEAAGNLEGGWAGASAWFWWGAGNTSKKSSSNYSVSTDVNECGECFIALWRLMFTYFTQEKGLHNLIWVWNGQNAKFYPGSEYVDIIGNDIYANPKDYSSQKSAYTKYTNMDKTKLTALTECGVIPDMNNIAKDGAWWLYFLVWNDGAQDSNGSLKRDTDKNNFWSGEYYNTQKHKEAVYNSDIAITLDELPDLTKY